MRRGVKRNDADVAAGSIEFILFAPGTGILDGLGMAVHGEVTIGRGRAAQTSMSRLIGLLRICGRPR